jgi:hypothetical protein
MHRFRTTKFAAALGSTVLVLAAAVSHAQGPRSPGKTYLDGPAAKPELKKISDHLWVYTGPINVGVVRDGEKALLVDCGESWQWHEFKLTAYHFPGQTLYHGALLAEAGERRILFVGDSLTAGGIEDYCAFNRNWLGRGVGYDRCLELIEKLQPTDLLYAHRPQAFAYTVEDCRFMRANLQRRQKLFGEITPWDDPNYGVDGWWVMCRPWEQHVRAGGEAAFDVVVTNHSAVARTAACRAVPPSRWGLPALPPASLADASGWPKAEIPPKTDGRVHLTLAVPAGVPPGKYPVPVDLHYGSRVLPQFAVALVIVDRCAEAASESAAQKVPPGKAIVIKRLEPIDLKQPVPFSAANAEGLKIAFQTKGPDLQTRFTLREATLGERSHHRNAYRFTGDWSLAKGKYSWGGGQWVPCLYRADQFLPLGSLTAGGFTLIPEVAPRQNTSATFTQLTFQPNRNQVRNLVIYRGDDGTPPGAPGGLTVQADAGGVYLAWKEPGDNVGVAWYVISRAAGQGKFVKIAQTADPAYTDRPPAAGRYRYRVLAADYERNMGPWSAVVAVDVAHGSPQPAPSSVVADASYYADHVRAVHDAGAGKVNKGFLYCYGDCINYLDRTRDRDRAMLPLVPYAVLNEIRNPNRDLGPVTTSATLLGDLDDPAKKILTLRPEFCVVSCGMEDLRAAPRPDPKVVVDNVLQIVKKFEAQGTVVVVATTNPYGHTNPLGSPEEALSDALAKMCEENKIPVARVFDVFRNAARSGEDYAKLMHPADTDPHGGAWPKGFAYIAMWPSFEEGLVRRLIVVKETLDRVLFTLLDRP